jgi:hypothetical protein
MKKTKKVQATPYRIVTLHFGVSVSFLRVIISVGGDFID